jgi:hypothetical protein
LFDVVYSFLCPDFFSKGSAELPISFGKELSTLLEQTLETKGKTLKQEWRHFISNVAFFEKSSEYVPQRKKLDEVGSKQI